MSPASGGSGPSVERILFVFLDGIGIGGEDPSNPFLRARLPVLTGLLGGGPPLLSGELDDSGAPPSVSRSIPRSLSRSWDARLLPLDACLGVEGLPQSGTGQIALLTGENAPLLFGGHFGPWPPVRLRPLLADRNLLRLAVDGGARVIFANAYPEGYPDNRNPRWVAAPPLAARSAGLLTRHHRALARGEAVASEIVNEGWRRHLGFEDVPDVEPAEAGRILARLARSADLTLFAHYLTDTAGHRGGMTGAIEAIERVDAFLGGVLDGMGGSTLLVVASDHGNLEDVRGGHTRNPALGLAVGPGAEAFAPRPALTDVAPTLLGLLGI